MRTPAAPALSFEGQRWSYQELQAGASALAAGLAARGAGAGDRIALLAGNRPLTVQAIHAVPRLGATLVPLNLRLTDDELAYQLTVARPRLLLADAERIDVARRLAAGRGLSVVVLEDLPSTAEPAPPVALPDDQVHTIMFTSGTTGRPKGAMLSAGNHFASAVASLLNLGVERDDRWLCCVPLFHMAGLSIMIRSAVSGFPIVLQDGFDPQAVNRAIDNEGVTIVSLVPVMLQRLLDARDGAPLPATFRCALTGGGPVPRPLLDQCAASGVPVTQTYGLTETASQVVTLAPREALSHLGAAGRPLWGTRIRLMLDDVEAAPGEAGEIQVQGPTVMSGYFNDAPATAAAFVPSDRDGPARWLRTGDIGFQDKAGYLHVLDRRTDLIISGGENVYPAEVEAVLLEHPGVAEVAVVGLPDPEWGQRPAAFVVPADSNLKEDDVIRFAKTRLAGYKLPALVILVSALPRTAAGKIQRHRLRGQVPVDVEAGE